MDVFIVAQWMASPVELSMGKVVSSTPISVFRDTLRPKVSEHPHSDGLVEHPVPDLRPPLQC